MKVQMRTEDVMRRMETLLRKVMDIQLAEVLRETRAGFVGAGSSAVVAAMMSDPYFRDLVAVDPEEVRGLRSAVYHLKKEVAFYERKMDELERELEDGRGVADGLRERVRELEQEVHSLRDELERRTRA